MSNLILAKFTVSDHGVIYLLHVHNHFPLCQSGEIDCAILEVAQLVMHLGISLPTVKVAPTKL